MQNNSQGCRDRFDPKDTPVRDGPNSRGLRIKAHPIDEAAPPEVIKSFAVGVVTDCMKLYVRKEPAAGAEVLTVIDRFSKVMIDMDASADEFYKVCTASGVEGFCMKKYIAPQK